MTEHPISLPPKLWDEWIEDGCDGFLAACEAARWGADQELDACIDVILAHPGLEHPELLVEVLRTARRSKSTEPEGPEEVKKWMITNCAFSGMPPAPYRVWSEWAEATVSARVMQGVDIKALKPRRCLGSDSSTTTGPYQGAHTTPPHHPHPNMDPILQTQIRKLECEVRLKQLDLERLRAQATDKKHEPIKSVSIKYDVDARQLIIGCVDEAGEEYGRRIGDCPWDEMPISNHDTNYIEEIILAAPSRELSFKRLARLLMTIERYRLLDCNRVKEGRLSRKTTLCLIFA